MTFLTRKGFLIEEQGTTYLTDTDPDLPPISLLHQQGRGAEFVEFNPSLHNPKAPTATHNPAAASPNAPSLRHAEPPNHRPARPTQQYQLQNRVERPILRSNA